MKKLSFLLLSIAFAIFILDGQAHAVPDIRGQYLGTYSIVVSNCTNSSSNGTYNAVLEMNISTQNGNTFSGTATGTFEPGAVEYIQLSGTITESGHLSGNTTHTFLNTAGEGTFTGQLCVDSLTIENTGQDTLGDTCQYTRYMSEKRPSTFLYNEFKINSPNEESDNVFGAEVSISGDYAIVTDMNDDDVATNSGAAYIFRRNGTGWTQEAKLTASDGAYYDRFGRSASISGNYAIVGAPFDSIAPSVQCGSVYIFEKSGSDWIKVSKLTGSNESAAGHFGNDVSISGEYIIVGVPGDDETATDSGSAYIFRRSNTGWIQEAKLTASDRALYQSFGQNVSISGEYAIVGIAPNLNTPKEHIASTYIFKRNSTGWIEETKIVTGDDVYEYYTRDVSISGDYAIISVANGDIPGAAYIFKRNGTDWVQEAKLTASDGEAGDFFGSDVSLSGKYAVVGRSDDNESSGSVYIFERCESSWAQKAKLTASDGVTTRSFGGSLSQSGEYIIVGTWSQSAYIYNLSTTNNFALPWIQLMLLD